MTMSAEALRGPRHNAHWIVEHIKEGIAVLIFPEKRHADAEKYRKPGYRVRWADKRDRVVADVEDVGNGKRKVVVEHGRPYPEGDGTYHGPNEK